MKKYLILIFMLLITISVNAQKKLTLNEAISIALQRNTGLLKSTHNLDIDKSNIKSAYGDLLPTLGVRGSWSWQRIDDAGVGLHVNEFGQLVPLPATKTDSRTYSVSAGGSVTLFDGLANYSNISRSKDNLKSAEYSLEKLKQDLVLQTIDFYYSVIKAKAQLKVREDNLEYNQKLFETIDERNKLGVVPIADVYTQQVQLGNAQLALIQAENIFQNSISSLLNYLALDVLDEYTFENPFEAATDKSPDSLMTQFSTIGKMVTEAMANRSDYQSQKLNVSSAESGITIAKGGLFPIVTGNYGFSSSASRTSDVFNRKIWSAGLTLNFPIFSNWNTENQIEFAKVQVKNSYEDLYALERQIKIEVKQGYLDLVASKKALEVSNENVKAAGENRRVNTERYNLGSGTILDVLQSDKDYTDALNSRIEAAYAFYILVDDLKNKIGKLDYKNYK